MRISDWSSDVCSSDLHHVDGDAVPGMFAGDRFGKRYDPALARCVYGLSGGADTRCVRRDMYDASRIARHHSRQHRVVYMRRAEQADGFQFVPLFGDGIGKWLEYIPSCVVYQNINGAQARFGGFDGSIDLDHLCDVA